MKINRLWQSKYDGSISIDITLADTNEMTAFLRRFADWMDEDHK